MVSPYSSLSQLLPSSSMRSTQGLPHSDSASEEAQSQYTKAQRRAAREAKRARKEERQRLRLSLDVDALKALKKARKEEKRRKRASLGNDSAADLTNKLKDIDQRAKSIPIDNRATTTSKQPSTIITHTQANTVRKSHSNQLPTPETTSSAPATPEKSSAPLLQPIALTTPVAETSPFLNRTTSIGKNKNISSSITYGGKKSKAGPTARSEEPEHSEPLANAHNNHNGVKPTAKVSASKPPNGRLGKDSETTLGRSKGQKRKANGNDDNTKRKKKPKGSNSKVERQTETEGGEARKQQEELEKVQKVVQAVGKKDRSKTKGKAKSSTTTAQAGVTRTHSKPSNKTKQINKTTKSDTSPSNASVRRKGGSLSGQPRRESDESLRARLHSQNAINEFLASQFHPIAELHRLEEAGILSYKRGLLTKGEKQAIRDYFETFKTGNRIDDDDLLTIIMDKGRSGERAKYPKFWPEVAAVVPGRPVKYVRVHVQRMFDPRARKGAWSKDEDAQLMSAYGIHPDQWTKIANIVDRSELDCRDRWKNELKLKDERRAGAWTPSEEQDLIRCVKEANTEAGNDPLSYEAPWDVVAQKMGHTRGRTQCRQKWHRHLHSRADQPIRFPSSGLSIANSIEGEPKKSQRKKIVSASVVEDSDEDEDDQEVEDAIQGDDGSESERDSIVPPTATNRDRGGESSDDQEEIDSD